jgi:DNA-binding CsgD family transcriptional regulator
MYPDPDDNKPVPPAEGEKRLLAMHGASDTETFIEAVFRLLQGTVQCDFVLANLHNIDRLPLVARDSLGREFGPEYMARFFKLNPSVAYVLLRPGLRLLHTRDHLPAEAELRQLPFYREFMQPEGWRHSVALLFWGFFPPVPQTAFCVFRSPDQPDFDADDLARLRLVYAHIAVALKRLKKQLKNHSTTDRVAVLLDALPVHATLLDWDLRITHQSIGSRRLAARWAGRANESLARGFHLPPSVLAECAKMKTDWRAALTAKPETRILQNLNFRDPHQPELYADISLVLNHDSALAHPGFLVRLGQAEEMPRSPIFAALSPAEREAAELAATGLSNEEIATRLGISVAATKLRLHGTFKKLNIRNRAQLSALAR